MIYCSANNTEGPVLIGTVGGAILGILCDLFHVLQCVNSNRSIGLYSQLHQLSDNTLLSLAWFLLLKYKFSNALPLLKTFIEHLEAQCDRTEEITKNPNQTLLFSFNTCKHLFQNKYRFCINTVTGSYYASSVSLQRQSGLICVFFFFYV